MKKPKKFRVGRSNTGLGLFATETIEKRELIVEYTGRLISNAKARELEWTRANRYLFELNSRWTIDGSSRRNIARYANHACEPNAEADRVRGRMMYRALAPIPAGDQITIDYGEEYVELFLAKTGCKCAACEVR